MDLIKNLSASQSKIKADIISFINNNEKYKDFSTNFDSTTVNLFIDILSGYASWSAYKSAANRNETYLYSAVLDSSVFTKAREFGYNLSRAISPKIRVIYNSVDSAVS